MRRQDLDRVVPDLLIGIEVSGPETHREIGSLVEVEPYEHI